ncbi:unnamed protein product [Rotaria sp. Silwood1]|nr:unnamed protein product [Rotaria sp. Silwood1]CAF4892410.1 unnamed protein product [Rotaria sp. Silwood1]
MVSDDVSVLLGYGNGSFENQTRYSVDFHPMCVTVGDFNNDTRLDIAVASYGNNDVSILLGYGNGSFGNQTRYSVGSSPYCLTVGDFNNDTRLDIVVANSESNDVSVLLGYGNGSFENHKRYSVGSSPFSITVGDFNNDTRLDIVVANYHSYDVSVLLGYGNGSFENQTRYLVGSYPFSVTVGDFNNDTRLDIVLANAGNNDVSVLLGYGNGSFGNQTRYSVGSIPYSVSVGDFNNDTRLDIVVTKFGGNDVSVLLGYGNGSFGNQITYSAGSYTLSAAVGDFNNDTWLDIVVTNSYSNVVSVILRYTNKVLLKSVMLMTGYGSPPQSLVISDFNNDDLMDIGVANSHTHNIDIFLGYGDISFANQVTYSTGPYSYPCSMAVGDLNNDTRVDIIFASCGSDRVGIILGYGNGSFGNQMMYPTRSNSSRYYLAAKIRSKFRGPILSGLDHQGVSRVDDCEASEIDDNPMVPSPTNTLVKISTEKCQKDHWELLSLEIEHVAKRHDTATAYAIIRRLCGTSISSRDIAIKDKNGTMINNSKDQLKRWEEYFHETFNVNIVVNPSLLQQVAAMRIDQQQQNRHDKVPPIKEVITVIDQMKNGKASGIDDVPAELLKAGGLPLALGVSAFRF